MNYEAKYQQGDVLLLKVDKATFLNQKISCNEVSPEKNNRHELAYGEETGHCHAVYLDEMLDKAGLTLYKHKYRREGSPALAMEVSIDNVVIKHEEHKPLTIPKGFYIQRIVREYNPLTGRTMGVVD